MPLPLGPGGIVRILLAVATFAFAALGLVFLDDPRWFVASGVTGTMWLAWDVIRDHVLRPFGTWAAHVVSGAAASSDESLRPNLEETIRFLEGHLEGNASRQVQINAAVRLEEIYRLVRKDPDRAGAVVRLVRARFPDAQELARYRDDGTALGRAGQD